MTCINLSDSNNLLHQFVSELRDVNIQTDRMRFRKNIERIGQIMAYEVSKHLNWKEIEITTPLGKLNSKRLAEQPVLATILRAGLSMHNGLLDFFDKADCAFISAYRNHTDNHNFEIKVEYKACPSIEQRDLIIIDPMLATGQSIVSAYHALLKNGIPKNIHILGLIASKQGIKFVQENIKSNFTLWTAAVDEALNEYSYIVPGLGDAGDLCFGEKL
ncbi:MAG: uracil phosphoribosyltransferase [Bacteroidia bacterium]|nr:uracil phosphoribosyltransferase [Bacteroidia bacterium]MCZ2141253.1 uracil phosphoribosyltransferase [Bacteroidia bacterium]